MKIAITGHKKGIGQEFARQLAQQGHHIVGISRSDGENIRRVAHTASLIEPCDVFINNAISMYAQRCGIDGNTAKRHTEYGTYQPNCVNQMRTSTSMD